jgi:hypothetical protein
MKLLDTSHPFLRPLWRRVAIVVFSLCWALFELSMGEPVWAIAFAAIGLFCAWTLLVAYRPGNRENNRND